MMAEVEGRKEGRNAMRGRRKGKEWRGEVEYIIIKIVRIKCVNGYSLKKELPIFMSIFITVIIMVD